MTGSPFAHNTPSLAPPLLALDTLHQASLGAHSNDMTSSPFVHPTPSLDTSDLERCAALRPLRSSSPAPTPTLPKPPAGQPTSRYVLPSAHLMVSLHLTTPLLDVPTAPFGSPPHDARSQRLFCRTRSA